MSLKIKAFTIKKCRRSPRHTTNTAPRLRAPAFVSFRDSGPARSQSPSQPPAQPPASSSACPPVSGGQTFKSRRRALLHCVVEGRFPTTRSVLRVACYVWRAWCVVRGTCAWLRAPAARAPAAVSGAAGRPAAHTFAVYAATVTHVIYTNSCVVCPRISPGAGRRRRT